MNESNNKPLLERESCSRCGGCGQYSYCMSHGSTCFKCGGKGTTLTKRGFEANKYLIALRSKPAVTVQPGDVVREDIFTMSGASGWRWATVTSVKNTSETEFGRLNPQHADGFVTIQTETASRIVKNFDPVRIKQSTEQSAQTLAAALEYQATLTKSGTVRKSKKNVVVN